MIRNAATLLALFAAGPASALSCLAPNVGMSYVAAAESPADYVIAVGALTATGPSNPPEGAVALNGDPNSMVGYTQQARFEGRVFTGDGFDQPWTQQITAEVSCVAAWCGSYGDIDNALFFFRRDAADSYALELGPCPGWVFNAPDDIELQQIVTCYRDGC